MPNNIPLNERLIFALDVDSTTEAERWVERLGNHVGFYKVGLQLFLAGWFPVVDMILNHGHKVMIDLKFFDIPETVALAVKGLQGRGITFATVHGNDPILRAAIGERGDLKILAVTVLTSFDKTDLVAMGLAGSIEELVLQRARKALDIGCDGVVASALEIAGLRQEFGKQFLVVSPGIRPGHGDAIPQDDQKRVATAYQAILDGADHVVVGRPIRNAPDPLVMVKFIQQQIATAVAERQRLREI